MSVWGFAWRGFITVAVVANTVMAVLWLVDPQLASDNWRGFAPWYLGFVVVIGNVYFLADIWEKPS